MPGEHVVRISKWQYKVLQYWKERLKRRSISETADFLIAIAHGHLASFREEKHKERIPEDAFLTDGAERREFKYYEWSLSYPNYCYEIIAIIPLSEEEIELVRNLADLYANIIDKLKKLGVKTS